MITVQVKAEGLDTLVKQFAAPEKQVRFATMVALNRAAFSGAEATKAEVRKVFDRPTPWVVGGVRYLKATKERLRAQVDFDFWGNKQGVTVAQVLAAEIQGGNRRLKRFELALQRIGVLPPGMAAVPGSAAKLDSYGNMSAGQINQILSFFRAFGEQGYKANMTAKGRAALAKGKKGAHGFAYFALTQQKNGLPPGIWQRFARGQGSTIKPVLIFVHTTRYTKRLAFYEVGQKAATEAFRREFPAALDQAMRTAR